MNPKKLEMDFAHDPVSEPLCRALLLHHLAGGRPEEARQVYRRFVEANALADNFALSPTMEELGESLRDAGVHSSRRTVFSPRRNRVYGVVGLCGLLAVGAALSHFSLHSPSPPMITLSSTVPLSAKQQQDAGEKLMAEGLALYHAAHYDDALSRYAGAEALAERWGERGMQCEICLHLADIHTERGDLQKATETTERALTLCGNAAGVRSTLLNKLASLQYQQGHLEESRALYLQTLPLWKQQKVASEYIWTLLGLGDIALKTRHLSGAEEWYHQARTEASFLHSGDMDAAIDLKMARFCLQSRQFPEAHRLTQKGLAHWTAKRHPRWLALAHLVQSEILKAEGKRKPPTGRQRRV